KQLNLNKLSDAGGPKNADVRRSQKPTFGFICVYAWIPLLAILSACVGSGEQLLVQSPSLKGQRRKISHLQKKLEVALAAKEKAAYEVERLQREMDEAQLAVIRRHIDDMEQRKERQAHFFAEEREALYRLIQSGDPTKAFEAQMELDRILRIITELSDEERHVQ
ncbi:MAG: hypothetical protein KGR16_08245, partial [Verrucomicrobia bacterium]|nr:hypothetical protein [Verrucomicrobiota bacterium]